MRLKKLVKKDKEEKKLRVGTWDMGSMTGRGRELVEVLKRWKVDILCIQETKWGGSTLRNLGEGYRIIYHGENNKNGVEILVNEKYSERIVKIERYSDRLTAIQLVVKEQVWNVFSAYAPQVGRPNEEKEEFWERLEEIPQDQGLIIGGDLNAHLGKENAEFKEEHGQMGYGTTNMDGKRVLEIIQALDINAINTAFKKEEHLITFKSGNHASQIDYILVRKERRREVKDCKVFRWSL